MKLGTVLLTFGAALIALGGVSVVSINLFDEVDHLHNLNEKLNKEIGYLNQTLEVVLTEREAALTEKEELIEEIEILRIALANETSLRTEKEEEIEILRNSITPLGYSLNTKIHENLCTSTQKQNSNNFSLGGLETSLQLFIGSLGLATMGGYGFYKNRRQKLYFSRLKKNGLFVPRFQNLVTVRIPREQLDQYIQWRREKSEKKN